MTASENEHDTITDLVDWQLSHKPQERHTCPHCRTWWYSAAILHCPECAGL